MRTLLMLAVVGMFSAAVVWPNELRAGAKNIYEFFMDESGHRMTKLEATKQLIVNGQAKVYRCTEVEMSDKLTIKRKK